MTGPRTQPTPADPENEPVRSEAPAAGAADDGLTVVNPRRLLFRLAAIVVVVVVAVLGYTYFFARSDANSAKVGDCVSVTGSPSSAKARRLACNDPAALYVVTATGRKVNCDASEVTYTGSAKLCLFYNLRVGECLRTGPRGQGDSKSSCQPGVLKVVYVDTSSADETKCPPEADVARTDSTYNRMVCFVTVT